MGPCHSQSLGQRHRCCAVCPSALQAACSPALAMRPPAPSPGWDSTVPVLGRSSSDHDFLFFWLCHPMRQSSTQCVAWLFFFDLPSLLLTASCLSSSRNCPSALQMCAHPSVYDAAVQERLSVQNSCSKDYSHGLLLQVKMHINVSWKHLPLLWRPVCVIVSFLSLDITDIF